MCSLEALVTRSGDEVIIEVNDCAMGLLGESQEEDRKNIAEVVLTAMESSCLPPDGVKVDEEAGVKSRVPPSVPDRQMSRTDPSENIEDSPERIISRRRRSDSEGLL